MGSIVPLDVDYAVHIGDELIAEVSVRSSDIHSMLLLFREASEGLLRPPETLARTQVGDVPEHCLCGSTFIRHCLNSKYLEYVPSDRGIAIRCLKRQ